MFVSAMEATIVATAMPSIVASLGGMELYSWVFSGFLLMQVLAIPIYGKLADVFGRKRIFVAGTLIFLTGSILCALSQSMPQLVAARLVQGIGAGSIHAIAMTILGDLYTREERPGIQAYLSSVWIIAAVTGPITGSVIVENAHWSWIFWMNLPIGLAAIALLARYMHESLERKPVSIDYAGAALMLAGLTALMLAFTQSGAWGLWGSAAMLAAFAILFRLFIWRERRAPDPVMHLELWSKPVVAIGNLATLAGGVAMIGVLTFMPIYIQQVQHRSAFAAGMALCALSVGWPLATAVTGRLMRRGLGTQALARGGAALVLAGALTIALLIDYGLTAAVGGTFVMGAGLGVLSATILVAIQSSVGWSTRGVATASNVLMRTLGNALGAALFGGMLNFILHRDGDGALGFALQLVFWAVVLFSVLVVLACWFVREPQAQPAAVT
jgi:EmrB/QacA subfamily drug resistance transporter